MSNEWGLQSKNMSHILITVTFSGCYINFYYSVFKFKSLICNSTYLAHNLYSQYKEVPIMSKHKVLTWIATMLYIASALGTAALAEEAEEWFEESSPAAETIAWEPSAPTAQSIPGAQPSQPSASAAAGGYESTSEDPLSATMHAQGLWMDMPEESNDSEDWENDDDNPAVYRVLFITTGGRILLDYDAAEGTAVTDPRLTPSVKGHTFSHWYKVGSSPNSSFQFGAPLEGNLTLAAFFQKSPAKKPEPAVEQPEMTTSPEDKAIDNEENLQPIQVKITSDAGDTIRLGDRVTLTANVTGNIEGDTLSVWRYDAGNGWVAAATNTPTHSFVVDEDNCLWKWEYRITVNVGAAD